ncbi:hypothetical protein IQ227_22760 [Anabaena aphanizomenioides LEGE 00250]|uniref:DUF104 domain-containing protein n=1 Tax=Sphaerospermopsis aphanizomenoides LEGE 00250 TaxID=2777972 RepID=A0ABR9VKK6_9CYAN|nr:hypothetical protein [Sphaerospermopsis aphanizomenoides]MBE9238760.1 hypothetical protein [Sphaerospermopsis aphanizomenoides LEGE 00250]
MLQSIEGIYQDGKIELTEMPAGIKTARVIVTFIDANASVDLSSRGINEEQAANLRARLQCFAEDWEQPEMEAYDAL